MKKVVLTFSVIGVFAIVLLVFSNQGARSQNPPGSKTADELEFDQLFATARAATQSIPPGPDAGYTRRLIVAELENELESFATNRAPSRVTTGAHLWLARSHQQHLGYASAMEHYALAWAAVRDSVDPRDEPAAIESSGGLAKLLALTGRLPELNELEAQVKQRSGKHPIGSGWQWAMEMRAWATKHPNDSYKCGLHCLDQLGRVTQPGEFLPKNIVETASTTNGFTAADLVTIAGRSGLRVHAALLNTTTNFPVPCIIHLVADHFVVVRERRGEFYNVYDPAAYGPKWLTAGEIAAEATGCVIVSDAPGVQPSLGIATPVDNVTAAAFRGRCHGPMPWDHDDSGCNGGFGSSGSGEYSAKSEGNGNGSGRMVGKDSPPAGCIGCRGGSIGGGMGAAPPKGMPTWRVSEPHLSLWIDDVPLAYQPAIGPAVNLHLAYNPRHQPSTVATNDFHGAQFGNPFQGLWACSLFSYAELSSDEYTVDLLLPGGGWATFDFAAGSNLSGINYRHNLRLEKMGTAGAITNLVLYYPDGSQASYGVKDSSDVTYAGLFYVSKQADPAGNFTAYSYDTSFLLTNVTAADSTTFTFHYADGGHPDWITSLTTSYGAEVSFTYISYAELGAISGITDAAGLTSQFTYESLYGGQISELITPYGTTTFNAAGDFSDQGIFGRTVRITHPNGTQEFYGQMNTYGGSDWPEFAASQIPTNTPVNTLDTDTGGRLERNTFYWNAQQFAPYVGTSLYDFNWTAFNASRIRHWLAKTEPTYTHFGSLSLQQEPSPDGTTNTQGQLTWFDYTGKPIGVTYEVGTQVQPSVIAQVMPDGSTAYQYFEHTTNGLPTIAVEKWATGNVASYRTNSFTYAGNGVDLTLHIGPSYEQVSSNYFNAYHQVLATYDALNQETKYTYDGTTRLLTSASRPSGLVTTNVYFAGNNRLQQTIDLQINRTNSYTWAANGNVDSHTDERGLTVTNFWDGLNRLTGTRHPDGTTTTNQFTIATAYPSSSGGLNILDVTATKDRLGLWTYFGYDSLRRRTAVTNANNVISRFGYCDCGAMSYVTNGWSTPVEQVTWFEFDNQGNKIYTHLPDVTVTNFFDSLQRTIVSCDPWGCRWFYYDNLNRPTANTNSIGMEMLTTYDIEDRPIYVTDANGVTVTNTYDLLGRLGTRTAPDGGAEKYGYSARGLVAYTNQLNFVTRYVYDEASRKTFETNANSEVIQYTNNAAGDLIALVDGKNQVTKWNYDEYGRVTNKVDQASVEILRYKYDPDSRLTNRWSAAKGDTKYKYDAVGNLTNIDYAVSTDVTLKYDPLNRVTNMVDAAGTTVYGYTIAGRLFTEDGPWASDTVTNFYNNGLRTNLVLAQPTGKWTNGFAYDEAKRLTSVTSPAGSFTYTLGAMGAGSPLIQKLLLPNTSYITNAYDNVARMRFTKLNNSSHTTLDSALYGYNAGNQRVTFTNAAGTWFTNTYDSIGQLKIADSSTASEDRRYVYDAAWNLSFRTNNTTLYTFKVDTKNQLTNSSPMSNQTYDGNGNLTFGRTSSHSSEGFSYDDENRLANWYLYDDKNDAGGVPTSTSDLRTEFVYDGMGRLRNRIEYTVTGTPMVWIVSSETRYVYDGMRVVQERDTNNTPAVSYTRGTDLSGSLEGAGGIGGLLGRSHAYQTASGNWTNHNYYHADGNGNITYMVNSSQTLAASYRYDPFGNTTTSSGTLASANVYRFSSKEIHVNSGLYYYGYRFYSPSLQRWLNRDPIGEFGEEAVGTLGFLSPANLFTYVANDPNDWFDDFGQEKKKPDTNPPAQRSHGADKCRPKLAPRPPPPPTPPPRIPPGSLPKPPPGQPMPPPKDLCPPRVNPCFPRGIFRLFGPSLPEIDPFQFEYRHGVIIT